MKANRTGQSFMKWMSKEVNRTTTDLLTVLSNGNAGCLEGVPEELSITIHNLALYNVLKVVNFPTAVLTGAKDEGKYYTEYEAFANHEIRTVTSFCEALRRWEPGKKVGSRKKVQKSHTEEDASFDDPFEPAEDGTTVVQSVVAQA